MRWDCGETPILSSVYLEGSNRIFPSQWPSSQIAMGSQRFTSQVPLQEHNTFSRNTSFIFQKHFSQTCTQLFWVFLATGGILKTQELFKAWCTHMIPSDCVRVPHHNCALMLSLFAQCFHIVMHVSVVFLFRSSLEGCTYCINSNILAKMVQKTQGIFKNPEISWGLQVGALLSWFCFEKSCSNLVNQYFSLWEKYWLTKDWSAGFMTPYNSTSKADLCVLKIPCVLKIFLKPTRVKTY